jgi:hypothetical protein
MRTLGFDLTTIPFWTTWVPLAAGALVTCLVIWSALTYGRWRRRVTGMSREEDLPWEELLGMLEKRNRDRAEAGLPPEEASEKELADILANMPSSGDPRRVTAAPNGELSPDGDEKRSGRRRWGNPIAVHIHSTLWAEHLHGLVVNRSTGGLGIFADKNVPPGTLLKVRAVEAPSYVSAVRAEVRHCRRLGKGYFFGCEFCEDVPWNARVWFG